MPEKEIPMSRVTLKMKLALVLLFGGLFSASPVLAEKPDWAGSGKGGKNANSDQGSGQRDHGGRSRRDKEGASSEKRTHFDAQQRAYVREYYATQSSRGRCPPGLAKKNNGCMPPGQARKWALGYALPRDVVYYEVPRSLVVQIGTPPSGTRYVRVASDILMIAIGTRMIVDAIEDLGR